MSVEPKEQVSILAKACAHLVSNHGNEKETEASVEFVAFWNHAIKHVTPLEFCRMICEELTKGNSND